MPINKSANQLDRVSTKHINNNQLYADDESIRLAHFHVTCGLFFSTSHCVLIP